MTYVSLTFAAFVAVLLVAYYAFPRKYRWTVLLAGSIVFYALSGPKYLIYVAVTAVTTYFAARFAGKGRRFWITAAVIIDLGILIVLKYTDFFITNVNAFLPEQSAIPLCSFVLPIGLSFYTFSAVGYVVDVSRGKYEPERNFLKFFLYLTYFPHIIEGPIPRYEKLAPQLYEGHELRFENLRSGFELVLWGVFKKLVIADAVAGFVNLMVEGVFEVSGLEIWLGMFVWGIRVYADFSGGVDVSRGVSTMLGVEMDINFKRPYFATDLSDFWNRWHISLGSWLKDYFFYPVGFSKTFSRITKASKRRFGKFFAKTVPVGVLSLILFTLVGVWHGANWGEVLFGVFNGVVIMASTLLEPIYAKLRKFFRTFGKRWFRVFQSIRTCLLITLARVFSLPLDIGVSGHMYRAMFGFASSGIPFFKFTDKLVLSQSLIDYIPAILGCLLLLAVSLTEELTGRRMRDIVNACPAPVRVLLAAIGTASIIVFGAYGIGYSSSNFIYSNY